MLSSMKEKTLTLTTKDSQVFSVKESVALKSSTIKNIMESNGSAADTIPLPDEVEGRTFALLLECLNKHADSAISDDKKKGEFDSEFLNRPFHELLEILSAAYKLEAKCLISPVAVAVARLMQKMTVEQLREAFGVENDYNPEEEDKIRHEVAWALK